MGLITSPEVRMARKIIQKHSLKIPFDLDKLVEIYAKVIYKTIPIDGVDGICVNLKVPGKTPTVIVNNTSVITRQRFTLAHELGHIIIPWHLGTIVDEIDVEQSRTSKTQYMEYEREANRFASELLMPFDWIFSEFQKDNDFESLVVRTCAKCRVSEAAARIRLKKAFEEILHYLIPENTVQKMYAQSGRLDLVQAKLLSTHTSLDPLVIARHMCDCLSGKIAFCVEEDHTVIESGCTNGTQFSHQIQGNEFNAYPYPSYESYNNCEHQGIRTHWWTLDVLVNIPEDGRTWREILDKIAEDVAPGGAQKFKQVIGGKLSGLNSSRKSKSPDQSLDDFIKEALHRFNHINHLSLLSHPDFQLFIKKRSEAFYEL